MPDRSGLTPFRIESRSTGAPSSDGLEEELQRRLRVLAAIWALITFALAASGIASNWGRMATAPRDVLLASPVPIVLVPLCIIYIMMTLVLAPGRRISLAVLRTLEIVGLGGTTLYLLVNVTTDLHGILPLMATMPIDAGAAHASVWGAMMVGTSVLVPATWRHGAIRTGVLFLCSFVPDIIVLSATPSSVPKIGIYLGFKVVITSTWAILSLYGSYRVAILRRDAREARQLGQYVLREQLGEGGMGEVYRAEHQFLRRPCAVKLIRPDQAGDENTLARFEREVQATAALTHPNTVQIYDYGLADDGTFYYVMEYLTGESLDVIVARDGPFDPARVVRVLVQLCGALAEAHSHGLVHRDIKPGNVVLGERGGVPDVAKLLDFGLVAPIRIAGTDDESRARLTQSGLLVGTPEYMSPEQCAGDGDVGAESDVYALGVLGFFLLVGRSPFAGRGPLQMIIAHMQDVPQRVRTARPDVSEGLDATIARCLEKNPADRFASVKDLEQALTSS